MEFTQIDELGLKRTYYVVTELEYDNKEYVIYSDLLKDNEDEFRLLIGTIENGKVVRVDQNTENIVKSYFKTLKKDYENYIKELF